MSKKQIVFPKTRKEIFLVLFKYHKMDMVKLNLLTVVFGILTIAAIYLFMLLIGSVPTLVADGSIQLVKPGDPDYSILFTSLIYLVTLFGCLLITNIPLFLGLGGLNYALSQLISGVPETNVTRDFFTGLKRNWKYNLFVSIIFSLACLFSVGVTTLYILVSAPVVVSVLSFIIAGAVFILVSMCTFIALNHNNLYSSSFKRLCKNSFLMAIAHPFRTFGLLVFALIPFLLLFIPFFIPIFPALMIFFGFTFFMLIEILYTNWIFDKYINKKAHPEIVNQGMNLDKNNDKNNN